MNENENEHRSLIQIRLSDEQYSAIVNTKCQGAVMVVQLGFKPVLSPNKRSVVWEASGTEVDALDIYDWADFCCP